MQIRMLRASRIGGRIRSLLSACPVPVIVSGQTQIPVNSASSRVRPLRARLVGILARRRATIASHDQSDPHGYPARSPLPRSATFSPTLCIRTNAASPSSPPHTPRPSNAHPLTRAVCAYPGFHRSLSASCVWRARSHVRTPLPSGELVQDYCGQKGTHARMASILAHFCRPACILRGT
ncbi:hypothetical protein C8R47DRAFT_216949 [Mycena vitilis]|nr:hypothetical protein C8R47DRAFT_216949 [Mycena vitilis]